MKKYLSIILEIILAACLAACGIFFKNRKYKRSCKFIGEGS